MDKLLEALKQTNLSATQVDEISKAVETMVSEAVKKVEAKKQAEYDTHIEEAYDKVQASVDDVEAKALQGYQQAHEIIQELQLRLETLEREYENKMEEGYQQAWEMLQAEQMKNENIEVEAMQEAKQQLNNMREFMVEKLDHFLQLQKAEIYDEARRDVLNDPKMVEHRVALEKMAEIMSDYLSVEDLAGTSSKKISEAHNYIENLEGRLKIIEKKNINQQKQIHNLNESLRSNEQLITEAKAVVANKERKERKNSSGNVSGRGQRVLVESKERIIPEYNNNDANKSDRFVEGDEVINDMLVLSGLCESK